MSDSDSPPREIVRGIHWLGSCRATDALGTLVHQHTSAFLVIGENATAFVDTGNPREWNVVGRDLERLLAGRRLDWLFPTHPEYAHAGSLRRLLRDYPESRIVGDVRDYHLFFPDEVDRLVPMEFGEVLDLGGGCELELVEAPVRDLDNSQWAFERSSRVLFVGDGFAYTHMPGEEPTHLPTECRLTTAELPNAPTPDQALYLTRAALQWTRFVDADFIWRDVDAILERLSPRIIAPGHGNVIMDIDRVSATMSQVYREVYRRDLARRTGDSDTTGDGSSNGKLGAAAGGVGSAGASA